MYLKMAVSQNRYKVVCEVPQGSMLGPVCIFGIAWMSQNFLQLSQDKRDVMVIGELGVNTSQEARHVGVTQMSILRYMKTIW